MTAKKIIEEITELDSLFGLCAKKVKGNTVKEVQFIEECFDHIKNNPKNMQFYFGSELVSKISDFCK